MDSGWTPDGLQKDSNRSPTVPVAQCKVLRTRSFTNRFKIANVTGQIRNTRARETQHSIDDRVQTYELQYRRTCAAILKLRGNGPWEDILKVLDHSDVRALNERELTAQEKEDIRWVRERNSVVSEADDINAERVLATVASVGEGHRRPSWIWYTGNVHEDMNDPLTRAGAYESIILFLLLTNASVQPYELNGQRQKHTPIGGRRRRFSLTRRCDEFWSIVNGRKIGGLSRRHIVKMYLPDLQKDCVHMWRSKLIWSAGYVRPGLPNGLLRERPPGLFYWLHQMEHQQWRSRRCREHQNI
jgi:hypothetical protein